MAVIYTYSDKSQPLNNLDPNFTAHGGDTTYMFGRHVER